jgi:hypothetical protein
MCSFLLDFRLLVNEEDRWHMSEVKKNIVDCSKMKHLLHYEKKYIHFKEDNSIAVMAFSLRDACKAAITFSRSSWQHHAKKEPGVNYFLYVDFYLTSIQRNFLHSTHIIWQLLEIA